jgi:hypothetical protein
MTKLFKFEERISVILVRNYEIESETEDEAWLLVAEGKGLVDSYTEEIGAGADVELYDIEDIQP